MHNVDFKSDLETLYYISNVTMLSKRIPYKYHIYAQFRL